MVVFSHYPSDPRPRREAESLIQLGLEVDVISIQQNRNELRRETVNGVNVLRVPLQHRRAGKFSYLFQYASFLLAAFFVLAFRSFTRRYALVHVHNMPDVLVFSSIIPKLLGAGVILDLHDPMPELMMTIYGLKRESFGVRLMNRLEKWSIRFADVVLTPNISFAKLFTARSCRADKLLVVMNSPDERIFEYREVASEVCMKKDDAKPFVIMYHGALVERHGLDMAVLAVESLRRSIPGVQLHVFGRSTPFFDGVMKMVQDRGLQDVVKYMGAKNLNQIVAAIDACDVGIIPNHQSAFTEINMPTRIFEYLARAKPVIVPSTTGIRDYFSREEIIFFQPEDVNDLTQKMQFVFANPGELNEIIRRGQVVYRAHRWNAEQSKFQRVVCELINKNSGPQAHRETASEQFSKAGEAQSLK